MLVTVTVAVPSFVVSANDVARTVSVAAVSSAPTERKPPLVITVLALDAPSTVHVTVCAGVYVPVTAAVNICAAPPFCTSITPGDTVTPDTVGTGAFTVTVAVLLVAEAVVAPFTLILVFVTTT
jgi:hypothetical protein